MCANWYIICLMSILANLVIGVIYNVIKCILAINIIYILLTYFVINIYMKNCKLLQKIYFLVLIRNDLYLGLCSTICRK